jgi:tetratricopeptide (TPR) repeat protein
VTTFAVFLPVVHHDFVSYDDNLFVTENYRVQSGLSLRGAGWAFTTLSASNWFPLTWLSHMLDVELFGMDPGGHHLTNLLWHLANTVLLFLLLRSMTGALWRSFFAAALFGVHPLHVESVAWVAQRRDVLSTFFLLLTLLAYGWYVRSPGWKRYLPVAVCLACGLMAKPMLVTLPFVLLLLDVWPLGRLGPAPRPAPDGGGRVSPVSCRRAVAEKVPLAALAAAAAAVTVVAQARGGTVGTLEVHPLAIRLGNAVVSYTVYLVKTVWPRDLAVFYPHPGRGLEWWKAAAALLFLLAVTAAVTAARRRRPYLAVGWFWYLGTLVPVIGLVQVGSQAMADRYTYVPLVGIFIMATWGMDELTGKIGLLRKPALAAAAAVLVGSIFLTKGQLKAWDNTGALFRHALENTEENYLAHYNYGWVLAWEGKRAEALQHFSEAVRIDPLYQMAHYNIGVLLALEGRLDAAEAHYRTALQLNSEHGEAHTNLADLLIKKGEIEEAIRHLQLAIKLNPTDELTYLNFGIALERSGDMQSAVGQYREVLRLQPENEFARERLYELTRRMRESGR